MPQMHPLTKWILGALFVIVMSLSGVVWNSLAEDVQDNKARIEKLDEAVQEIKTQGAVQEALQSEQNNLLRQVLIELKNGSRRPGS